MRVKFLTAGKSLIHVARACQQIFVIFLLCSCAYMATPREPINTVPFPGGWYPLIRNYVAETAFDPASIIDFEALDSPQIVLHKSGYYMWAGSVAFNAKNRFGGYGGRTVYYYLIRDDVVRYFGTYNPTAER